jgi:hypothetical protein
LSRLDLREKDTFVADKIEAIDEIMNKKKASDKKMEDGAKKVADTITKVAK